MNPQHIELAESVIDFFKKSSKVILIPAHDLSILIGKTEVMESVIYSLEKDYQLIERKGNTGFRLTDKGWKFTTFEKLEKDSKKTPLTLFQKWQLFIMTLSLISAIILGFSNYFLTKEKSELREEYKLLKSDFIQYKDSLNSVNYNR